MDLSYEFFAQDFYSQSYSSHQGRLALLLTCFRVFNLFSCIWTKWFLLSLLLIRLSTFLLWTACSLQQKKVSIKLENSRSNCAVPDPRYWTFCHLLEPWCGLPHMMSVQSGGPRRDTVLHYWPIRVKLPNVSSLKPPALFAHKDLRRSNYNRNSNRNSNCSNKLITNQSQTNKQQAWSVSRSCLRDLSWCDWMEASEGRFPFTEAHYWSYDSENGGSLPCI